MARRGGSFLPLREQILEAATSKLNSNRHAKPVEGITSHGINAGGLESVKVRAMIIGSLGGGGRACQEISSVF